MAALKVAADTINKVRNRKLGIDLILKDLIVQATEMRAHADKLRQYAHDLEQQSMAMTTFCHEQLNR